MKLSLLSLTALLSAAAAAPFEKQVFGVITLQKHVSPTTSCVDNIFSLRGGAVHESGSLEDLEARIQSAALNDKLTVIDFTAT